MLLLTSGASVTWAHHAILAGKQREGVTALVYTVVLAAILLDSKHMNILKLHLLLVMVFMVQHFI